MSLTWRTTLAAISITGTRRKTHSTKSVRGAWRSLGTFFSRALSSFNPSKFDSDRSTARNGCAMCLRLEVDLFSFLRYGVFGETVVVAVWEVGAVVTAAAFVAGQGGFCHHQR